MLSATVMEAVADVPHETREERVPAWPDLEHVKTAVLTV